jgi:hypothetical protein
VRVFHVLTSTSSHSITTTFTTTGIPTPRGHGVHSITLARYSTARDLKRATFELFYLSIWLSCKSC